MSILWVRTTSLNIRAMPVQSMTQPLPLRSRSFVISAFVISVVLTFIFYTEFVHDHFSLRDLPKIGNQIFARPPVVSEIPKKLWYKLGPKGITDDVFEWTGTCIRQNPAYQFQFMTDDWADEYVERTFSNTRPDIVEVYLKLKIPIVKADLLRYLVLYVEGGVWSDLDVSCEGIPIDEWVPEAYKHNASLVVGWEFDYGWDGAFFHQFASWTILSRPGVRHMLMVIDDIVKSVHLVSLYHEVPIEELTKAMVGDIVDFTGMFSNLTTVEIHSPLLIPSQAREGLHKALSKAWS